MSIDQALTDIEIKLHDARRQLEGLIKLSKMDIPLPNEDIIELQRQISEMQRLVLNFYLAHNRTETTVLETPQRPTNVVEFPGKKNE